MWTVRENREDIDAINAVARSIKIKEDPYEIRRKENAVAIRTIANSIQPAKKPYSYDTVDRGHVFYDFAAKREAVFAGYSQEKSPFIRSLFSHDDESMVGEKPKVRKYVRK